MLLCVPPGCPWRHVNAANGVATCYQALSGRFIRAADRICSLARLLGGDFVGEWSDTCYLWKDRRVRALTPRQGSLVPVFVSAAGWTALQTSQVVTIRKRWKFWTTHTSIATALSPYQQDPEASFKTVAECCGIVATNAAHYTLKFAEIFWRFRIGTRNSHGGFLVGRSAASSAWVAPPRLGPRR